MQIIDRYIFKTISIATVFVTLVLAALVLLTQSLRFLDLVINSGASGFVFWILTALTLPKFLEIILPIGLVASVLFVYNRLTMDSELVVLRSLGFSPLRLARPALLLSGALGVFLFLVMGWVAPAANDASQAVRTGIKAQMTTLMFREGVFNQASKGLMVYIRERDNKGAMRGLIIHDARNPDKEPSTIIADHGVLVTTDTGQQVLVYNGSRQDFDTETATLKRLDFDQYTIDMPASAAQKSTHWKEPDERSFFSLFSPDLTNPDDRAKRKSFRLEIFRRVLNPFLVPSFTLVALLALLRGTLDRRGLGRRILGAVGVVVLLQVLYLGSYNLAKQSSAGYPLMSFVTFGPLLVMAYLLKRTEESAAVGAASVPPTPLASFPAGDA